MANIQKSHHYVRNDDIRFPEEKVSPLERVKLINDIIDYEFNDPTLLQEALTHFSIVGCKSKANYKRLEFLGDAVLGLLIAKYHYSTYPNSKPGELTRLRSVNVDNEKLARVAFKHKLYKFLRHNHQSLEEQVNTFRNALAADDSEHSWGLMETPNVLADIVESLVGAVYVDSNSSMDTTWMVVKNLLEPTITLKTLKSHPLTKLDEFCHKYVLKWRFKVDLWEDTRDVEVLVNENVVGRGNHRNKKYIACKIAAQNAHCYLLTQISYNTKTKKQKPPCLYRYVRSENKRFPEEKVSPHERVKLINDILDYEFSNPSMLEESLTHRSFSKTQANYERLEYIGDAVLGLLVAKYHYFTYPDLKPGELTELRATNVNTMKLARVALKHELYKFLRHNHQDLERQVNVFRNELVDHSVHSMELIKCPKVLADIVESLIGAIYEDSKFDMDKTWKVVKKLLEPIITQENLKCEEWT